MGNFKALVRSSSVKEAKHLIKELKLKGLKTAKKDYPPLPIMKCAAFKQ